MGAADARRLFFRARHGCMHHAMEDGMTELILFNVFNGLIVGAFYALMALGLSMIINLTSVINFAHGGFLALGAYIA
jgi:ABC-type branched-subunit amino acid transport system permease subunit